VHPVYVDFGPAPAPVRSAAARGLSVSPQPAAAATNATLVVQFPAAAEVWVGGKKSEGDPATEWTLTAPVPGSAGSHTFEVKGRWKADRKTFEASRSVAVITGDRGRLIIASGTEVKK
jgi:hypothetical protein